MSDLLDFLKTQEGISLLLMAFVPGFILISCLRHWFGKLGSFSEFETIFWSIPLSLVFNAVSYVIGGLNIYTVSGLDKSATVLSIGLSNSLVIFFVLLFAYFYKIERSNIIKKICIGIIFFIIFIYIGLLLHPFIIYVDEPFYTITIILISSLTTYVIYKFLKTDKVSTKKKNKTQNESFNSSQSSEDKNNEIRKNKGVENILMLFLASLLGFIASDMFPIFKGAPLIFQAYAVLWFLSVCALLYVAFNWIEVFKVKLAVRIPIPKGYETLVMIIITVILVIIVFVSPSLIISWLKTLLKN